MTERNAYISAFMDAVTTGQTHALPRLAQRAYAAGVSREELLHGVPARWPFTKFSRPLNDRPPPLLRNPNQSAFQHFVTIPKSWETKAS